MMARQNQKNISLKNNKLPKGKIIGNRFGYLSLKAILLSVLLTISLSAWLFVGHSVAYIPLARDAKEGLILVQQESPSEESPKQESPSEESPKQESPSEESPKQESPSEESPKQESPSEQKLPLEEEKKSLEEKINERYEEWESQRTASEISHSISAIATIVMTVLIGLLGTGLLTLPHRRLIIIILAIITVLIQLNLNIFLLEKSLGGYQILEEQSLILKNKLKSANTDEELAEIREQFQELVIESINIE
jgi:DNA mismatch repair ATPase MutL